jgi:hypothetical protein
MMNDSTRNLLHAEHIPHAYSEGESEGACNIGLLQEWELAPEVQPRVENEKLQKAMLHWN